MYVNFKIIKKYEGIELESCTDWTLERLESGTTLDLAKNLQTACESFKHYQRRIPR